MTNAGVRILDARPLDRGTPPPGQSEFHLTALDAGGHVLYDAPMFAETPHIDHGEPGVMLHGLLPRGGVAVIEITRNGAVVAKRVRGAAPARLRLLSPLSGSATGRRPTVAIGWRASGPGASDSGLEATVEYSTDNGRSWRTLFIGPDRGDVDLPNRYFAKSSQARVRVRVSNGFTDSTTTSGRFSALGSPPTVRITSPGRNERMTDDAPLYLSGIAFDDALAQLHGRRLRWYADRQLLGTGEKITATGIPPGTRRIRLVARDSNGRAAEAFVPIAIRGSKPLFIALGSPKKLSRRGRGLTLRAASDIPATLTIGRAHFPVNSMTRSIKQRVRPGKGTLVLRLRLTSHGKSTTLALRMTRPRAAVR